MQTVLKYQQTQEVSYICLFPAQSSSEADTPILHLGEVLQNWHLSLTTVHEQGCWHLRCYSHGHERIQHLSCQLCKRLSLQKEGRSGGSNLLTLRQCHCRENTLQCSQLHKAGRLDGQANKKFHTAYHAQEPPRSACQWECISFPLQGTDLGINTHKLSWSGSACMLLSQFFQEINSQPGLTCSLCSSSLAKPSTCRRFLATPMHGRSVRTPR